MTESEFVRECNRLVPLGPWLELCREAGVPCVPAEFSQPFPVDQMAKYLDGWPCVEFVAALDWLKSQVEQRLLAGERPVARWESCCGDRAKSAACRGEEWGPAYYDIHASDDCRAMECMCAEETRLCIRPWVDARRIGGYPVEFRVFVGPDGVEGASSYYPQRPLPETVAMEFLARRCMTFTHRLAGAGSFPEGFTADYLVADTYDEWLRITGKRPVTAASIEMMREAPILFLEGGPPHHGHPLAPNAHPCAMKPGDVHGIALVPRYGALSR